MNAKRAKATRRYLRIFTDESAPAAERAIHKQFVRALNVVAKKYERRGGK